MNELRLTGWIPPISPYGSEDPGMVSSPQQEVLELGGASEQQMSAHFSAHFTPRMYRLSFANYLNWPEPKEMVNLKG